MSAQFHCPSDYFTGVGAAPHERPLRAETDAPARASTANGEHTEVIVLARSGLTDRRGTARCSLTSDKPGRSEAPQPAESVGDCWVGSEALSKPQPPGSDPQLRGLARSLQAGGHRPHRAARRGAVRLIFSGHASDLTEYASMPI